MLSHILLIVIQVPSLTGKEDDEMEGDQLMFDLDQGFAQGFTQEQVDGMYQQHTPMAPHWLL